MLAPPLASADQVDMQNGDRYVGKVVSLSADTLILQNEMLGTIRLPRSRVAQISLGAGSSASGPASAPSAAPRTRAPSARGPAANTNVSNELKELSAHTNLIQQVQKQFLSGAGPEANQKFDELLNGLMSGKLSMDDLRAQAQAAADQLRELKRQGGQEAGIATDTYLAILDQFLKEAGPAGSATNTMVPSSPPKAAAGQPEN